MNRLGSRPDQDPEIKAFIEEFFPGYRETDMQFNIGRVEGAPAKGIDVINPATRERMLVTHASSVESETLLRRRLGNYAILPRWDDITNDMGLATYQVAPGARPLIKTLQAAPYEDAYMERLHKRAGEFMRKVYRLDSNMFGLTISDIALGHTREIEDDDTVFTAIPPLLEAGQKPQTLQQATEKAATLLDPRFSASFVAGMMEMGGE